MLLWINLLGRIFFHAALVGCFLRMLNVQKRLLLLYKESLLRRDVFRPRLKYLLSLIRQKGESQNGCFRKAKHAKFSEKQIFLTPWHAHVRVFQEKKARKIFPKTDISKPLLYSWNTSFEIRPSALLPTLYGEYCPSYARISLWISETEWKRFGFL